MQHALWSYNYLDEWWSSAFGSAVINWCMTILFPSTMDIVPWSRCFLAELDAVPPKPVRCLLPVPSQGWTASVTCWYKLNVDASLRATYYLVGLGAIIRDSNDFFMAGLSRKLIGLVLIEIAEAAAILNRLHLTIESSFSHLLVEPDALNVINFIIEGSLPKSKVGLTISDILSLHSRADVSFSFVPRTANSVAHSLARNSFLIDNVSI
ncbi:hypothetical protein ACOSP7_009777 [Xanthoceras sorbifolium]